MSQKKYPENEPSNERSSQSETPINEPSNERSSQSGTQGSPSSGQSPMSPGISKQNKCEVCGQTFSNQNELNGHYKTMHNMQAPAQQSQSGGGSSSSESRWSGQGTEKPSAMGAGKQSDTNVKTEENEENKASTAGSQNKMQNQYKCQRCGQLLSSQNDLNQHNKNVHGIEPAKMGKEHEEKKSMTK